MEEQKNEIIKEIVIKDISGDASPTHPGYAVRGLERGLACYYIHFHNHYVLNAIKHSRGVLPFTHILSGFFDLRQYAPSESYLIGIYHKKDDTLKRLRQYVYSEPINELVKQILRNSSNTPIRDIKIGKYILKDESTLPLETRVAERDITSEVRKAVVEKLKCKIENI